MNLSEIHSKGTGRLARRALATVAVLAAAGLVLAGCSASKPVASASAAVGEAPLLSIGAQLQPTSLNPALTNNNQVDSQYYQLAYDPLIYVEPDGSYAPALATAWKYKNANTFDITIRKNVKFSDGEAMTAKSVAASINYFRSAGGPQAVYAAAISSVTATNASTVEVITSTPNPVLPLVFSQAMLVGNIIAPKGLADPSQLLKATYGAGPYMLSADGTLAGSTYTYVKNPDYWDKSKTHYDKIQVKVLSDSNAALAALQAGQIDFVAGDPDTANAAGSGISIYSSATQLQGLLLMDRDGTIAPPLKSEKVRQALNYAIDRKSIATALFGKYGAALSQMALPGVAGYDPKLESRYPYDPKKAKELLKEAGYANGFTITGIEAPTYGIPLLDQAIVGQLAKVGVTLKMTTAATIGAVGSARLSKQYPSAAFYYGALPMYVMASQLMPTAPGTFNPFGSTDAQLTSLLNKAAATPGKAGTKLYQQAMTRVVDLGWFIPVVRSDSVYLAGSKIGGITTGPNNSYPNPAFFYPKG
jgi:peptide/nickel transport system substrate-binding protein